MRTYVCMYVFADLSVVFYIILLFLFQRVTMILSYSVGIIHNISRFFSVKSRCGDSVNVSKFVSYFEYYLSKDIYICICFNFSVEI